MVDYDLTYQYYGIHGVLIEWPAAINNDITNDIKAFKERILQEFKSNSLEMIPAYHSLLVVFKDEVINISRIEDLKALYSERQMTSSEVILWKLPVCYDPIFGVDLKEIAKLKDITIAELIQLHSAIVYDVHFLGFLPGFVYLGGLDEKLIVPRKNKPSLSVPKGAVAIGGKQTGIYPESSPGGWHIIGNCPIPLFDSSTNPPCFIKAGDKLQFESISLHDYETHNYSIIKSIHD